MKTLGYAVVMVLSCMTFNVHAEAVSAKEVCTAAADQLSLESPMDQRLISQCSAELKGKTFGDVYIFTEEESYRVEEVCVEKAQSAGDEQFDQTYESCVIREVVQFLKSQAE